MNNSKIEFKYSDELKNTPHLYIYVDKIGDQAKVWTTDDERSALKYCESPGFIIGSFPELVCERFRFRNGNGENWQVFKRRYKDYLKSDIDSAEIILKGTKYSSVLINKMSSKIDKMLITSELRKIANMIIAYSFEQKDEMRINDIIIKAGGNKAREISLAQQIAHAITDQAKAIRRFAAAESILGSDHEVTEIFFNRANELGGNITKLKKSPVKQDVSVAPSQPIKKVQRIVLKPYSENCFGLCNGDAEYIIRYVDKFLENPDAMSSSGGTVWDYNIIKLIKDVSDASTYDLKQLPVDEKLKLAKTIRRYLIAEGKYLNRRDREYRRHERDYAQGKKSLSKLQDSNIEYLGDADRQIFYRVISELSLTSKIKKDSKIQIDADTRKETKWLSDSIEQTNIKAKGYIVIDDKEYPFDFTLSSSGYDHFPPR